MYDEEDYEDEADAARKEAAIDRANAAIDRAGRVLADARAARAARDPFELDALEPLPKKDALEPPPTQAPTPRLKEGFEKLVKRIVGAALQRQAREIAEVIAATNHELAKKSAELERRLADLEGRVF